MIPKRGKNQYFFRKKISHGGENTVPAVWCEYSPQFTYFFKTWKFLSNLHLRGIKVKSNVQKIFKFHVLKRKLEKSFTKP